MSHLPLVMPANRVGICVALGKKYPNRLATLYSPTSYTQPCGDPYVLDNDRFSVWSKGNKWDGGKYIEFLDRMTEITPYPPMWAAVPDVVANPHSTLIWWDKWVHQILERGFEPALVVQDGMTPSSIKSVTPYPKVLFVGGTTDWKWRSLSMWTSNHPHIHVGRVNTGRLLWMVHRSGARSSDGTGWWHDRQYRQLEVYLRRSSNGMQECNRGSGFGIFRNFKNERNQ